MKRFLLPAICLIILFPFAPGRATSCSGTDHLESFHILSNGNPVSGAQITVYSDPQRLRIADNLATGGHGDAVTVTDATGGAQIALAEGTYYLNIIASGYITYTPNAIVPPDGTCGYVQYSLTTPSQIALSLDLSKASVTPTSIAADNTQTATVTIQAFNNVDSIMPYQPVDLTTNFSGITIDHNSTSTDIAGRATFTIRGYTVGTAMLTPSVNGQPLKPIFLTVGTPTPSGGTGTGSGTGTGTGTSAYVNSLVKLSGDPTHQVDVTTVYFVDGNGRRHAFPNEPTYMSWYSNYSSVRLITLQDLAALPLGANVPFKAGSLIKFPSVPRVYAIASPNLLRWVSSEQLAQALYGTTWQRQVHDLSEAFAPTYATGADIQTQTQYDPSTERSRATGLQSIFTP